MGQVIKVTDSVEEDAGMRKIEWVLSDGRHSFPANVDPEIAEGVGLYNIIHLDRFKLVRWPYTRAFTNAH